MATYNLGLVLKNDDSEYLLSKQNPPPKFGDEEYDSCVDSDLWDLPSTKLDLSEGQLSEPRIVVEGVESHVERIDLRKFDVESAIKRVLGQLGLESGDWREWRFLKLVEEAEFGPGFPVHTVYLMGKLMSGNHNLPEDCKWMSIQDCLSWLLDVTPGSDRVGPLVVAGLINETRKSSGQKVHTSLCYQEYPPGVVIVPMKSRTTKPFKTTNLVIFAPESISSKCDENSFVAHGDALIVDPGCQSDSHEELFRLVAALPTKLIVFVTHHHHDHVDGLSIVQKCNPEATLLVHENTMRRIRKGDWALGYTSVSGGEDICIGGQRLNVIFAPGHTDGHVALHHVNTQALIVGDHCVGQGSAILDFTSGGNMAVSR
uniref:Metallo-beta-lactamase domain-containing protein n=1 Tax=Rhizophora mucronata TaxID=61149 RepID=A0A2P2KLQ5_RHIMU